MNNEFVSYFEAFSGDMTISFVKTRIRCIFRWEVLVAKEEEAEEKRAEIRTVAFIWAGTLVDETYTAVAFLQTDIRQDGIASRNTAGFNATLVYDARAGGYNETTAVIEATHPNTYNLKITNNKVKS